MVVDIRLDGNLSALHLIGLKSIVHN